MQKLPNKKKTLKQKLDVRENEMKEEYYRELLKFYERNENLGLEENSNQKVYNIIYDDEQEVVYIFKLFLKK
jgi:hypothetical protein